MDATRVTVGTGLVSIDPATLVEVGRVPVTEPDELEDVVSRAGRVQCEWAREPLEVRARLLRRVVQALLDDADQIALTIVSETGKPLVEAYTSELLVSLDNLTWLSRNVGKILRRERLWVSQPYLPHKRASLHYEPVGVVAILTAWNFPLGVPLTQAATAVAAGNAVVLKPSELTPLTGFLVEDVFRRAGAPAGLVRVVQGFGETVGSALVSEPGVDGLVFTGSAAVGRRVAAAAATRLCPVILELGGKDPMLVLADADLDRAVAGALWGSFANCGQMCSGIERIYVARPLYDRFLEGLAVGAGALRLGRGDDPTTEIGPLATEERRSRVEALIADAIACGAEVVAGGARPAIGLPGWFHEPTVLAGEPSAALLREEEVFGPVVTVVSIDNTSDGIRRVNDSRYGLGASVWTRDVGQGQRVAEQIEAGSVWINDHAYSYSLGQAPWGGRKESGMGRTHSKHGLYAMSQLKYTDADSGRLRPPWWYPYSDMTLDGFRGALDVLYRKGVAGRLGGAYRHRRGLLELGRRALSG